MKTKVGLWIDHREAVVVYISDEKTTAITVKSNVNKQLGRINGVRSVSPFEDQLVVADDSQENIFMNGLTNYYESVYSKIKNADSLIIFGPGEAKIEFKKFILKNNSESLIVALETADKMTENQIIAKVVQYFNK